MSLDCWQAHQTFKNTFIKSYKMFADEQEPFVDAGLRNICNMSSSFDIKTVCEWLVELTGKYSNFNKIVVFDSV